MIKCSILTKSEKCIIKDIYNITNKATSVLIDFRKIFNGDLDCLLIYIAITLNDRLKLSLSLVLKIYGVIPHNVSEFTGISRETVRRKIKYMIKRGYIYQDNFGYLHITSANMISPASNSALFLAASHLTDLLPITNKALHN